MMTLMNRGAVTIDDRLAHSWKENEMQYVSFDPWGCWGEGATFEAAVDDLMDAVREMRGVFFNEGRVEPWEVDGWEDTRRVFR